MGTQSSSCSQCSGEEHKSSGAPGGPPTAAAVGALAGAEPPSPGSAGAASSQAAARPCGPPPAAEGPPKGVVRGNEAQSEDDEREGNAGLDSNTSLNIEIVGMDFDEGMVNAEPDDNYDEYCRSAPSSMQLPTSAATFAKSRNCTLQSFASLLSSASMTVSTHGQVHLGRVLLTGNSAVISAAGLSQEDMKGTPWTAYVSLVLTCLGSSILTVPWILAQSGSLLGCVALTLPALVSTGSVRWLVHLGKASSTFNYQGVMSKHIGPIGDIFTFITLNATIFLVSSSCCTIVSEVVPTLFSELSQFHVGLLIVGICAAPAAAKTLVLLHKFVSLGFIACVGLVGLIVGRAIAGGTMNSSVRAVRLTDAFPWSVALSNACFGVEMIVLTVSQEMTPESRHHVIRSADCALLTCAALYSIAGLAAYAQYGATAKPNILVSFGDDLWSKVAKVLLIAVNLARVPVFTFLQRDLSSTKSSFMQRMHRDSDRWFSRGIFGAAHVLASATMGYVFASAGRALGIAGGTVGIAINVGLPAVAWCVGRRRGEVPRHRALDALAGVSLVAIPVFLLVFAVSFVKNYGKI